MPTDVPFSCQAAFIAAKLLNLYVILMVVYAVISWVPSLRGQWTEWVARLVEPALEPVRRIIPPLGGFDIAFIVVIIALQWLAGALPSLVCRI